MNVSVIMINTTVLEKYVFTTITISNHCANSNVKQDKDHSGRQCNGGITNQSYKYGRLETCKKYGLILQFDTESNQIEIISIELLTYFAKETNVRVESGKVPEDCRREVGVTSQNRQMINSFPL
ncbi:hypothetical protein LOAG_00423 [Loa loa]|uniref:Uncharacterized protein n=1 Tax=Loa loa TaxID=7209 RepID=A0A1S0UBA8_LOALO|nr:hypothetical protein LOAG_00423 [Loa loa]EFO28051.1 hypothetical protein LOAG_00423 [Loa loa]